MSYRTVLDMGDFWAGEMRRVTVDGVAVLVVNVDDRIQAFLDQCPHKRIPLSMGCLDASTLTCGAHGWAFDATTGQGINPAGARLIEVPVCISGHNLQVDVSAFTRTRHDA